MSGETDKLTEVLRVIAGLAIKRTEICNIDLSLSPSVTVRLTEFRRLFTGDTVRMMTSTDAKHYSIVHEGVEIRACELRKHTPSIETVL